MDWFDNQYEITNGCGIGICTDGNTSLLINEIPFEIHKNSLLFIQPDQIVTIQGCNRETFVKLIYFPIDKLTKILASSSIPQILKDDLTADQKRKLIQEMLPAMNVPTQVIDAEQQQCDDILNIFDILSHYLPDDENATAYFGSLMIRPLIESIISIAIGAIDAIPKTISHRSRQEEIAHQFFMALIQQHDNIHDLSFYASKLCVSPKYLSSVVSQVTKTPAKEWISRITIFNAKQMLLQTDLTIAQIADRLNFSTPSTFIRFFRQRTGTTPKAYRNKE
ncbi:MAG: AraC family transcriptional regulator [Bacteroidales bacterium]|nr:AraC family transcriptional regulator [Bacteroidales bacterium]